MCIKHLFIVQLIAKVIIYISYVYVLGYVIPPSQLKPRDISSVDTNTLPKYEKPMTNLE